MMLSRRFWRRKIEKEKEYESKVFYIIFPFSHHKLCLITARHIRDTFKVTCVAIEYRDNNKKKTFKEIEELLREQCTLIIGYEGMLTSENCYKLGIAHAHRKQVVLVNLSPSEDKREGSTSYYLKGIPEYVRYQFLVYYPKDSSNDFLSRMENIISVLISNSLAKALYQKAVDICEEIENDTGYCIEKTDSLSFESKMGQQDSDFLTSMLALYLDDDEKLYTGLLYLVATKREDVFAFLSSQKSTKSISEDLVKIDNCYNISGDYIVGGKSIVNNDLSQSEISNFANEIKDNAQQQSD